MVKNISYLDFKRCTGWRLNLNGPYVDCSSKKATFRSTCTWRTFRGKAPAVLDLSPCLPLVSMTCALDMTSEVKRLASCLRRVQSRRKPTHLPPNLKGAAVIPTRLMNGDTLIFVIPNWCCGFN